MLVRRISGESGSGAGPTQVWSVPWRLTEPRVAEAALRPGGPSSPQPRPSAANTPEQRCSEDPSSVASVPVIMVLGVIISFLALCIFTDIKGKNIFCFILR